MRRGLGRCKVNDGGHNVWGVIRPSSSAGVFESAMNQLVFGIVPDRSGHRRQRGKLNSI